MHNFVFLLLFEKKSTMDNRPNRFTLNPFFNFYILTQWLMVALKFAMYFYYHYE